MNEHERAAMLAEMLTSDSDTMVFTVGRSEIEPGVSFSEPAMDALMENVSLWIGSRIIRRWEQTNEPPSIVTVNLVVTVG